MSLYLKRRKRYLKKFFVGICLFGIGALVFSFLALLSSAFPFAHRLSHPLAALVIMSVVSILVFKPLDIAFTKFFKHYLFKKKSYAHMALMNLAEEVQTVLNFSEMGNMVANTFGEILHLKTVVLLTREPCQPSFGVLSSFGWSVAEAKRIRLYENASLIQLMKSGGPHILVRDQVLRAVPWQEANELAHDFNDLRASWVIPLFSGDHLAGALGFASNSPEGMFDEADFQFFREFGRMIGRSVMNALRFRELELAHEELRDVQSDLLQNSKLAAIEQLATGIAHEIHNPLTIISGKAQVLLLKKDKAGLTEAVEEVLKTIVQQTQRAADITRKLLMFSQGTSTMKEPLDLVQVLNDTISLISYQTSLEGIKITQAVHGAIPLFEGNVHEIREIFLNLVLNAVQSLQRADSRNGKLHCEIKYLEKEEMAEVLIMDNGPGISKMDFPKLFNPFFTTRQGGVGLGLFVTRQIVNRYGGSIKLESREGEGTLCLVELPCPKNTPAAGNARSSRSPLPQWIPQ